MAGRLRLSATRLARRLRQQADTGLSPSQLSALATIRTHGPLTLGALAEHERVAPPSVTKVVAKLEAAGWVDAPARRHRPAGRAGVDHPGRRRACSPRCASARRRGSPPGWPSSTPTSAPGWPTPSTSSTRSPGPARRDDAPMSAFRNATNDTFRSLQVPQLPAVLQRPAHLADRQLAHAGRPDPARPEAHRQRRRPRRAGRRPVRSGAAASGRGPAWSPTAPTSASCCSSCRRSPWRSRSCSPRSPSAATRRCSPSTPWPSSAASPSPSTTRPAGRSWSRWCPRRTCTTR